MPYGDDTARLRALKANLGSSRLTGAPGTVYVALLRSTTPASVVGSEPDSTGNYARVAIANTDSEWTFGTSSARNTNEIRFPAATGLYSITDPLNQWALYDNNSGGGILIFGALNTGVNVTGAGDVPVISAEDLIITSGG